MNQHRSRTALPVAIVILLILGVVHFYWLTFSLAFVQAYLFPVEWLNVGTVANIAASAAAVLVLSLPLAFFIERLRPSRTAVYCATALIPMIAWYSIMIYQSSGRSIETRYLLVSMAIISIALFVAVVGIRRVRQ